MAQFKKFLGANAKRDITNITAADISKFRDKLAERVTPGTVNVAVKILRSAFAQARRDGLVDVNEAERVSILKRRTRFERRPFTLPELKRIIEVANDEWRGMVMFGLYTGQRLGDIATLTWQNLDLQRAELRLVTGKTGRRQIIPLAPPLLSFIESLPPGQGGCSLVSEHARDCPTPPACGQPQQSVLRGPRGGGHGHKKDPQGRHREQRAAQPSASKTR